MKADDFDVYTTANGLSDNNVTGVVQDSTGYLWISTMWGLNRFNGNHFVQFHPNSESSSLPAEETWGLTWLDKHRLIVMGTGLHIVDTRTMERENIFIPYHNKKYEFKFNMVMRVKGDEQGNIYILTRSGFYHYDKNHQLVYRFDYYPEAEVPLHHFFFGGELMELDDQRLLITSIAGLYLYDKRKKELQQMKSSDAPLLAEFLDDSHDEFQFFSIKAGEFFIVKSKTDSLVYVNLKENRKVVSLLPFKQAATEISWRSKLFRVSDTLFYLSSQNDGLFSLHFDPRSGKAVCNPNKSLAGYLCMDFAKDKEGRLLIATSKGVMRQRLGKPIVQIAALPSELVEKFPAIGILDVFASGDKVYAASQGGGILVFDKKNLQFERNVLLNKNGSGNLVRSIAVVNGNSLLLGTQGPLNFFQLNDQTTRTIVPPGWSVVDDWSYDVQRDSKDNIWISSHNIYCYNITTARFTTIPVLPQLLEVPAVIEEDRSGNIWMARHGIARYNTLLNKYDLFIDSFPYIRMPDKQVNALTIDAQNTVWFNSNNNGLVAYDVAKKTFRHFTRKDGLPDNNVSSLIAVGSKVWVACYSGIACIDIHTLQIESFGKEDGFPDLPVYKGSRFFYDKDQHQLYIGFTNTLVRFNPDEVLKKASPPQTFIEMVVINGDKRIFFPDQLITTSWKENEFNISIGSINFRDGRSQHYAYRISEDENTPWVHMGPLPSFSISGLSPGTHRIQVKTFSLDKRWPDQVKEIVIVVLPPFWRTTWFLVTAGILFAALIYIFIKWRIRIVRKKEMVKTQIEKLKADDYKAQFELEQISHYFSSSLADKKTEEEVLWDVAQNLIGRMNYEDCIIYGWNDDRTCMVQKAAYGPKGKPELISASEFEVAPGQGIVGHVIETKQPALVNDTRADRRYRIDDDFRLSEISVPIIHNDELLGVIDSEHHLPGYFTERDIKILTTIATLIGNKLKQLESEQSLEAKQQELAGINEQLAEARLSALQAQMNPHFVFNALNSIKRMILDGDNERASRYLSKFALMIRMTLNHSKEIFVTLDENIRYIQAYLQMEQLRFGDSFAYTIYTDDHMDLSGITIPSMMIQPLIENAIWHGLMQSEGEKKIDICFTEEGGQITCVVEDNGIGIRQSERLKETTKSQHRSVGLDNLRKRIKIMNDKYNMDFRFSIIDLAETGKARNGTRVVLQFNLINV